MRIAGFGTLKYRSLSYFVLRVGTILVGLALSIALRLALSSTHAAMGDGFWGDFARGGLTMLALAPVLLAAAYGGQLIKRLWTVEPPHHEAMRKSR